MIKKKIEGRVKGIVGGGGGGGERKRYGI